MISFSRKNKKIRLQIYTHVYAFVCTSNSYCLISFSILSSKFTVIIYTGLFSFIVHQKTNIQTNVKNRNLSWKYDIKSSIPFEMLYQFLVDNGYQKSQKKEFHRNKYRQKHGIASSSGHITFRKFSFYNVPYYLYVYCLQSIVFLRSIIQYATCQSARRRNHYDNHTQWD